MIIHEIMKHSSTSQPLGTNIKDQEEFYPKAEPNPSLKNIKSSDKLPLANSTKRSCYILRCDTQLNQKANKLPVFFFDLDNTLYSKNFGIQHQMTKRISLFFKTFLNLPEAESEVMGQKYYLDYGLAIRGIIREFDIDPLEYDKFVDGGLEFDSKFGPPPGIKDYLSSLEGIARLWIFTNAGIRHAIRVLELLDLTKFFEGIIYCDYSEPDFPAKPDRVAYERAMQLAGIDDSSLCYFVDDSPTNIRTAHELGWNAILLDEADDNEAEATQTNSIYHQNIVQRRISRMEQLYSLYDSTTIQKRHFNKE